MGTRSLSDLGGFYCGGGRTGSRLIDQPVFHGDCCHFGTIAGIKFGDQLADVMPDGVRAPVELFGDLVVSHALSEQGQHLAFALRKMDVY